MENNMSAENTENPLIPMGAITGRPSAAFLRETLQAWRDVGVTQFLIYPRSGCELEYMSEEWLDTCGEICAIAERLGFTSLWLYDEYNWPSGTCARRILEENPSNALPMLSVFRNGEKYEFTIRRSSLMSNLFSDEVVGRFLELTHARYEKRLGKYMGRLIKGFFTDEPDISFFDSCEHREDLIRIPWYEGMEEEYRRKTGGELRADILRGLATGSRPYEEVCQRLCAEKFRTAFAEKISNWCAARGMVLTGHLMNEYSAAGALRCNGHPLEVLSAFSLPGMDEIFTHGTTGTIEWLTLGTVMHAIEKRGNRGGLAELFALGPCDMTLEQMRRQIWLCAAFGVSRYVLAVSALTMHGNLEKPFYFNPLTRTQPWFPAFRELGEDAKRAAEFAGKKRVPAIAVRYPYVAEPLTDLLKHLTAAQFSWNLILPEEESDAEIILSLQDGMLREERSGREFFDSWCLEQELLSKFPRECRVLENDRTAQDVFLRAFEDGSAVVINLSECGRELVLRRKGKADLPFHLPGTGVRVFDGTEEPSFGDGIAEILLKENPLPESANTRRIEFRDGISAFSLKDDLENLTLAVRSYGDVPEILLDGKALSPHAPCGSLPQGFRELYLETAPFTLARGEHRLTLENHAEDYPYLPLAFLAGTFFQTRGGELGKDPADGLYGYAGRILQTERIAIPSRAEFLELDPQGLFTEIFLNGKTLGRRLWQPFLWKIPEQLRGQETELKILRSTSCGPLFGEKAFEPGRNAWLTSFRPRNDKAPGRISRVLFREGGHPSVPPGNP